MLPCVDSPNTLIVPSSHRVHHSTTWWPAAVSAARSGFHPGLLSDNRATPPLWVGPRLDGSFSFQTSQRELYAATSAVLFLYKEPLCLKWYFCVLIFIAASYPSTIIMGRRGSRKGSIVHLEFAYSVTYTLVSYGKIVTFKV